MPELLHSVATFSDDFMDQVLSCPHCGEIYLHHGTVTVYDRSEDAEASVTTVPHKSFLHPVSRPDRLGENPSARRHGLAIAFECETCMVHAELTIAQHKGSTWVEWRYVVLPDPEEEPATCNP
jgi:hypothetical protein